MAETNVQAIMDELESIDYEDSDAMFEMVSHIFRFVVKVEQMASEVATNPMARNMLKTMGIPPLS